MPDAEGLAAMLAAMVERGCLGGVIEVSMRGPDERRRVEGLAFDAAVVTDIGRRRRAASRRRDRERRRPWRGCSASSFPAARPSSMPTIPTPSCSGAVNLDARRVSFGLEQPADVTARIERLDRRGTRFLLRGFDREVAVRCG